MKHSVLGSVVFGLFFLCTVECGLFEPDRTPGSLRILLVAEKNGKALQKTAEALGSVRCVVKKDLVIKYDADLTNQGGSFHGEIAGLEPGSDYSVLLYGKNSSSDIVARGYKSGITVTAGKTETVTISWGSFTPALISPASSSTTNDNTPAFDWSDAGGAAKYELAVVNSGGSDVIRQGALTVSNYTPSTGLPDGTYTWKVRCQDEQGNWGEWSGTWSFTINTAMSAIAVSPDPLVFGSVTLGLSKDLTLSISNTGNATLNVTNITSTNSQFSVISGTSFSVAAGLSQNVTVRFTPSSEGSKSGALSIANNSLVNPKGVNLSGTGMAVLLIVATPTFSPSPGTYNSAQNVTISCTTSGSMIRYTANGVDPTESDPTISNGGSVTISSTTILKARAYMNGWSPSSITSGTYIINTNTGTVTDIDGNTYQTVTIDGQVWMAENLKVTHYQNGDAIPNVTGDPEWASLTTGAYCNYDNNTGNVSTYGRLYNWYAASDIRNIAPEGWHVPTDGEWGALVEYLGSKSVAGGKMKETGTTHWLSPNEGATNESGFSVLPGGYRYDYGDFNGMGSSAFFWTSTESEDSIGAWFQYLSYNSSKVFHEFYTDKQNGFSVRLVRDN